MTLPIAPQCWDIDDLTVDRTQAIAAFGFTERQARFLVTVMLHSGVFVERQYCAFAGIRRPTTSSSDLRHVGWRRRLRSGRCTVAACSTSTTNRSTRPLARSTTGIGSRCPRAA